MNKEEIKKKNYEAMNPLMAELIEAMKGINGGERDGISIENATEAVLEGFAHAEKGEVLQLLKIFEAKTQMIEQPTNLIRLRLKKLIRGMNKVIAESHMFDDEISALNQKGFAPLEVVEEAIKQDNTKTKKTKK